MLGFLPFVIGPWHLIVSPYATPFWGGYVKGYDVSLLDAVAVGIIFGTRGRWPKLALLVPLLIYLAAVLIAVPQARFPNLAASYLVQSIRVFLVFLAAARVAGMERGERAILIGLILGITVQAGYAILARASGALQTGGSLGHQNLLGFVSHMALMPAFAMMLAGRSPRMALLGVLAGIIVVILTVSRATLAFSAVGLVLTLILCVVMRFTPRKAMVAVASVVMLAASLPLAKAALDRRFAVQSTTFFAEDAEREAFEKAARAIIAAYPMGVGPNHYVFIANTEGYSERAGVAWSMGSRSTNVHNSYLLITAEMGSIGIMAFVALIACALLRAFGSAVRFRRQPGSEVFVGIGCGVLVMSLHGLFEWMYVVYPTQYLFAASLGLLSGMRSRFLANAAKQRATRSRPAVASTPAFT
jgi:O-antigen ligase